ncbi:hypothetical protein [Nocardia asiatica]|uniref:hypothetical protein n=1 Tax=Nocardia asiatica TaxID=209252 RepID=UPI002453C156|nr:hypothetical protein [Nocardia asiatica]
MTAPVPLAPIEAALRDGIADAYPARPDDGRATTARLSSEFAPHRRESRAAAWN